MKTSSIAKEIHLYSLEDKSFTLFVDYELFRQTFCFMRGQAMRKTLEILKAKDVDLSRMRALEVFAREGNWQTVVYAQNVKTLDAWEIDPDFEGSLRKNLPTARVTITDSIEEIKREEYFSRYDFIVVDNPMGCYGLNKMYCEHFDVIPRICNLLDQRGVLIFNINKEPFNFENFPEWQKKRSRFYKRKDTSHLSIPWLLRFYERLFKNFEYKTEFCFSISRGDLEHRDYLHYLVYLLKKI